MNFWWINVQLSNEFKFDLGRMKYDKPYFWPAKDKSGEYKELFEEIVAGDYALAYQTKDHTEFSQHVRCLLKAETRIISIPDKGKYMPEEHLKGYVGEKAVYFELKDVFKRPIPLRDIEHIHKPSRGVFNRLSSQDFVKILMTQLAQPKDLRLHTCQK